MRTIVAIILGISFVVGAAVFGNYFYRSRAQGNTIRVVGAATKRYESDIVKWRLDIHDWRHGFVLDGFPRNAAQAEFFLENYDIDAVIAIELPEDKAVERIQSRRLCSSCGLDYNLIQLRPHIESVCDNCGGRLVTRDDDTPEAIRTRLAEYREKTRPILELLREKELIVVVDGTPSPDVVQAEIRRKLGLLTPEPESDRLAAVTRLARRRGRRRSPTSSSSSSGWARTACARAPGTP